MDKSLRLRVAFDAIDKLSGPIKALSGGSTKLARDLAAARNEVTQLEKAQGKTAGFRKLKRDIETTRKEMQEAEGRAKKLGAEIARTDKPTAQLRREFKQAAHASDDLRQRFERQNRTINQTRRELADAGISTRDLAQHERDLANRTREANRQVEQQRERLVQLGRAQKRGARMKDLGGKVSGTGQSASLGMTLPLVGAGAAAVTLSKEFSTSMGNISTLIDTNVESMGKMKSQVLDLAKRTPVELEQLPAALYDIRSAGISAADSMGVLEGSARLGVAGLGSTSEAADLATSSINAFNLKGAEQARLYDTIFKTVKNGKTNISQLAQGFGGVAGTVAGANVKLDEYLASVAALTTTGMPAAQAHTQLRAVISGLTRDTSDTRKVFGALGAKDMKDLIAKSGGLVPALSRIKGELKGNDAAMLQLFGSTEALNAALGLTGNQAKVYQDTLADMRSGANAIDPAFAKQAAEDSAKQSMELNKLRVAAIKAGAALVPVMTTAAEAIGSLADKFSNLSPSTQKFLIIALALAAAIGPLLIMIGGAITALGSLATVAGVVGIGLLPLVGIILAVVAALGVIAYAVYSNWDAIAGFFSSGIARVKGFFSGLPNWMRTMGKAMMEGLLSALNPLRLAKHLITLATKGKAAFKKSLGINSPSRVFMEFGGHISDGMAIGVDKRRGNAITSARRLATSVAGAATIAASPSLASTASTSAPAAFTRTTHAAAPVYNITVHVPAGSSGEDIGAAVRRELEAHQRREAASARSTFGDD